MQAEAKEIDRASAATPRVTTQETVNLHMYLSTFVFESRIQKETATIKATGFFDRIIFLGIWGDGLKETEELSTGETVNRVRFRRFRFPPLKALGYFQYWARAFRVTRGKKLKLVHVHALNVLLIAVSLKLFKRCKLLYAPHELETESNGLRGARKILHKILEGALIRFVDATQVVGEEIAGWYRGRYGLENVFVVRNIPRRRVEAIVEANEPNCFRTKFNIPEHALVFLYQGFLNRGRGIKLLLEAFTASTNHHLVLMGYGPLEEMIKSAAASYPNVHFHEAVPPANLPRYTGAADVGLSLIENTCLSYYYCLPNKLYEYIHAGLPVIASNFPEMRRLVQELKCGWLVDVDTAALRELIQSLDRAKIEAMRKNALARRSEIGWHTEEPALRQALSAALGEAA